MLSRVKMGRIVKALALLLCILMLFMENNATVLAENNNKEEKIQKNTENNSGQDIDKETKEEELQKEKPEKEEKKVLEKKPEKKEKKELTEEEKADRLANKQGVNKFPYSYQSGLRALGQKHEKWKFVPVYTGISWKEAMEQENKKGRNTIQSTFPTGGNQGSPFSFLSYEDYSYNWASDKFKLMDGTNWYNANSQVVAYYMDPRNFFNDEGIFQFQSLSYSDGEKKDVVEKILQDSFMNGSFTYKSGNETKTISYAEAFLRAGKKYKISSYFLASRARVELGRTKTASVTGTVPGYAGYYNFYNIGANDKAGGGAALNGLRFAAGGSGKLKTYGRPWNSQYKAIDGGAEFLARSYVDLGQDTMYFQKFSVRNKEYLFWHQYQTNVMAPTVEGKKVYESYKKNGVLNEELIFYIPIYNGMPQSPAALPKEAGNPNAYLKSIAIRDNNGNNLIKKLIPSFSYDHLNYKLKVTEETGKVSLKAYTVSKYAKIIKGTGDKRLDIEGEKEINIVVEAQDKSKEVYTINVTGGKKRPEDNPDYGTAETISFGNSNKD